MARWEFPASLQGSAKICFQGLNFIDSSHVALFVGEFCGEVSSYQVFSELHADHARAQHQDVHVVVLHTLMSGIGVVTDRGADALDFIGGHACADTAATDQHATVGIALKDGTAHRCRKI